MLTRVFKSGNSLAIRIPKELAFMGAAQDVEIEKLAMLWSYGRHNARP